MRIAIVCHYLPPNAGGIEHVVHELACRYVDIGCQVQVLGLQRSEPPVPPPYGLVPLRGWNALERFGVPVPILEPIGSYRRVRDAIRAADGVHVHGLPYPASLMALACARRSGVPAVVTEHVGLIRFDNPVLAFIEERALDFACRTARRSATACVVLNQRVQCELEPRLAPVPVVKIRNGVDKEFFRPGEPEERDALRLKWGFSQRATILFVGRNAPKKGLNLLVQAVRTEARYDLIAVGNGTEKLHQGDARVRGLGPIDSDSVAELYRAADLLALPSEGEGLPLVVQEALASGLPVLLADDPALRSELPSGPVSFVDRNAAAIALGIAALLDYPLRLSAMRSDATEYRKEQGCWRATAQRYLELLGISHAAQ